MSNCIDISNTTVYIQGAVGISGRFSWSPTEQTEVEADWMTFDLQRCSEGFVGPYWPLVRGDNAPSEIHILIDSRPPRLLRLSRLRTPLDPTEVKNNHCVKS